MCEVFHVLPYAGGLFDQPYPALLRMEKIKLADGEIDEAEEKTQTSKAEAEERVLTKLGASG